MKLKREEILKAFRILGLMTVLSYLIVILFSWVYANIKGYAYFSAGEPELLIKYPEWALGTIGILAAVEYLRKELNDEIIFETKALTQTVPDFKKPFVRPKAQTAGKNVVLYRAWKWEGS